MIDEESNPWSFGISQYGQLGLGDRLPRAYSTVSMIDTLYAIVAVATGGRHSLFLDFDGNVWACGSNEDYRSSLSPHIIGTTLPERIHSIPTIASISAGNKHSLFLSTDGIVWACGNNELGELGLPDNSFHEAKHLPNLPTIVKISAGFEHSLFLDSEGSVWVCGSHVGLNSTFHPSIIPDIKPMQSIFAGYNNSMLIDDKNMVWSVGDNTRGQLGIGFRCNESPPIIISHPSFPPIQSISMSASNSLFLDFEGHVWVCGYLGDLTTHLRLSVDLEEDKIALVPAQILEPTSIQAIANGDMQMIFLDEEGKIWFCSSATLTTLDRLPRMFSPFTKSQGVKSARKV